MSDKERDEVAVLAVATTRVDREEHRSLEEMIFDTVTEVLGKAGMSRDDLESIVVSGNDEIDGRVISIMTGAGPAAGVGHDVTMIASSADHALSYGYLRILAGQDDRVLVVGWAKPSESVSSTRVELMGAEPYVLRQVGMSEAVAAGLQASKLRGADYRPEGSVVAWPLTADELPAEADSVHAIIIGREGSFDPGQELAWIASTAWSTSSYELGERDLSDLSSLDSALARVEQRDPKAAPGNWTGAEIGAASEAVVEHVVQQLQLDPAKTNASGRLSQVGTSPYVTGLNRMVAAIERVVESNEQELIAGIGFHGFASQAASVVVFSSEKLV